MASLLVKDLHIDWRRGARFFLQHLVDVPELRDVPVRYVHDPSTNPDGVPPGYAEPIVDHVHEPQVTLDRYQQVRARA